MASEWYRSPSGGAQGNASQLGKVIGPAFSAADIPQVIDSLVDTYRLNPGRNERFVDTLQRIGIESFKEQVYRQPQVPA